jgi:hypothetical protein
MHRYLSELYQVEAMMSILKLSVFLEVKDGEDWALTELPRLKAFSPSLQLEVAGKYRVDHWVEPAFRGLMRILLQKFDLMDVLHIGLQYYAILVNTKTTIKGISLFKLQMLLMTSFARGRLHVGFHGMWNGGAESGSNCFILMLP